MAREKDSDRETANRQQQTDSERGIDSERQRQAGTEKDRWRERKMASVTAPDRKIDGVKCQTAQRDTIDSKGQRGRGRQTARNKEIPDKTQTVSDT